MDSFIEHKTRRDINLFVPMIEYLKPYLWQMVGATVALISTAAITLSIGQGLRLLIDEGFANGDADTLVRSIAIFACLMVLLSIGTFVRYYLVSWIGERVSADIRRKVFEHLLGLHPGYFEENLPTELQSRITTDTTLLQSVIGSTVSIALRNILMFIGGIILLVISNPKLSLVVIISAPFIVAPVIYIGRKVRSLSRDSQDSLADVGSYVGESLRHIKIVQAFNHQADDVTAFGKRVELAFEVARRRIKHRAWLIVVAMSLAMIAMAAMLWIGGQDVLSGETSPGELTAFIFYAFIVGGSVGAISEVYSELQRAAGAAERLAELLEATSILKIAEQPQTLSGKKLLPLSFERVTFSYPTRKDIKVIDGISFAISPGEQIALVGPSGGGKSTLFDLMLRFYDPDSGGIFLDGIDLRELTLEEMRAHIGFVSQDTVLFAGTLEENLCYGFADASAADKRSALEAANALDFVESLPKKLQTRVGEGGTGLSGGQRQRLSIARALLTKPGLLLLDEATSALDADSEELIRSTIQNLRGVCTVVIIAHRLSTVVQADRILVVEEGKLLAQGTYQSLVESNPLFRRFAEVQFARSLEVRVK